MPRAPALQEQAVGLSQVPACARGEASRHPHTPNPPTQCQFIKLFVNVSAINHLPMCGVTWHCLRSTMNSESWREA